MREVRPSGFWLGLWLGIVLAVAKAAHWSAPALTARRLGEWVTDVGVSAHNDVLFAAGFGLFAAAVLAAARRWEKAEGRAWRVLVALGTLCAAYAVVSVGIFHALRSPLTYPLLYLAGDVRNMRSSVGSYLTPTVWVGLVLVPLAYFIAVRRTSRLGVPRWAAAAMLALVPAYAGLARATAAGPWHDRSDHLIARSPHWELLASFADVAMGAGAPDINEPFPRELLADFGPAAAPSRARDGAPKNVLVVVLESTAAKYMSLYGSRYHTTPNLDAEARNAVVFDSVYAHVGLTANSMAAMTLSVYPYMTWREYTLEYPDLPGTSLAQVLKPRGYRTAFIHSGNLEYVGQDRFLAGRGFDTLLDWEDLGGGDALTSWGGDEGVLVDRLLDWVEADRSRPFYAMAWTIQSHHPYEPSPKEPFVDFFAGAPLPPDDYDLGRYLNTVQQVDRQLGRLFAALRERGLADDTLVVVTSDHGQAFGDPHPNWGHGFRVFEENVRVPFVVWNPRLFPEGRRADTVGGHVDLNPTVTDLLGLASAPGWEGRSLFAADRPPRAYFYAANDDYLLGVREGTWKYVYNATRGREELYDLASDPNEGRNVAAQHPERCRTLRQRVAAWKDHAGRRLQQALAARTPPAAG